MAKIPDFSDSDWKLVNQQSWYVNLETMDCDLKNCKGNDTHNPLWFAYFNAYADSPCKAYGKEYDFFGRGASVKVWGLMEESERPEEEICSLLVGKRWLIYPGREYYRKIHPQISKKDAIDKVILDVIERRTNKIVLTLDFLRP